MKRHKPCTWENTALGKLSSVWFAHYPQTLSGSFYQKHSQMGITNLPQAPHAEFECLAHPSREQNDHLAPAFTQVSLTPNPVCCRKDSPSVRVCVYYNRYTHEELFFFFFEMSHIPNPNLRNKHKFVTGPKCKVVKAHIFYVSTRASLWPQVIKHYARSWSNIEGSGSS